MGEGSGSHLEWRSKGEVARMRFAISGRVASLRAMAAGRGGLRRSGCESDSRISITNSCAPSSLRCRSIMIIVTGIIPATWFSFYQSKQRTLLSPINENTTQSSFAFVIPTQMIDLYTSFWIHDFKSLLYFSITACFLFLFITDYKIHRTGRLDC